MIRSTSVVSSHLKSSTSPKHAEIVWTVGLYWCGLRCGRSFSANNSFGIIRTLGRFIVVSVNPGILSLGRSLDFDTCSEELNSEAELSEATARCLKYWLISSRVSSLSWKWAILSRLSSFGSTESHTMVARLFFAKAFLSEKEGYIDISEGWKLKLTFKVNHESFESVFLCVQQKGNIFTHVMSCKCSTQLLTGEISYDIKPIGARHLVWNPVLQSLNPNRAPRSVTEDSTRTVQAFWVHLRVERRRQVSRLGCPHFGFAQVLHGGCCPTKHIRRTK